LVLIGEGVEVGLFDGVVDDVPAATETHEAVAVEHVALPIGVAAGRVDQDIVGVLDLVAGQPAGVAVAVAGITITVAGITITVAGITITITITFAGITIAVAGIAIAVAGIAIAVAGIAIAAIAITVTGIAIAGITVAGIAIAIAGIAIAIARITVAITVAGFRRVSDVVVLITTTGKNEERERVGAMSPSKSVHTHGPESTGNYEGLLLRRITQKEEAGSIRRLHPLPPRDYQASTAFMHRGCRRRTNDP
jgi:hypothetical protein